MFCSRLPALFLCFKLSPFENERQVKCHYSGTSSSAVLSVPTRLLVGIVSRDKQLSALPKMPLHTKGLSTECIIAMQKEYINIYAHIYAAQEAGSYSSRERELSPANWTSLWCSGYDQWSLFNLPAAVACKLGGGRGCIFHLWVGNNWSSQPHRRWLTLKVLPLNPLWQPICLLQ